MLKDPLEFKDLDQARDFIRQVDGGEIYATSSNEDIVGDIAFMEITVKNMQFVDIKKWFDREYGQGSFKIEDKTDD